MSFIMSLPSSASAVQQLERFGRAALQNLLREPRDRLLAGEAEDVQHVLLQRCLAAERDQLIEHRLGIAQAAVRALRDRVRRRRLERHLLLARR